MKIKSKLVLSLIVIFSSGIHGLVNNIPKKINESNLKEAELAVNNAEKVYESLPYESKKVLLSSNMYIDLKISRNEIDKFKQSMTNSIEHESDTVYNPENIINSIDKDFCIEDNNELIADNTDDKYDTIVNNGSINNFENSSTAIDIENVSNVIKLIEELDEKIVLEEEKSLDKIEEKLKNIEEKYNSLNEKEKNLITNYEKLKSSKEEIDSIRQQLYAVYNAINKIPEEITLENLDEAEKAISKAEELYSNLKDEYKKGVMPWEYSIIESSRYEIDELRKSIS